MLQVQCREFGRPERVVSVATVPVPEPKPGELLVRVTTRPINPSDLLTLRGTYRSRIFLPYVPGYEGVGAVCAVGSGVPRDWLGRRVLAIGGEGTWREFATIPAAKTVVVPDEIADSAACQLYINPVTAWLILRERLRVRPGDVVIANAGASTFGRILCQLARAYGFKLILIVRRPATRDELIALGATEVFDAADPDLPAKLGEATEGRGATAALDAVGGDASQVLLDGLSRGGSLILYGLLSGEPAAIDYARARREQKEVSPFWLRDWSERADPTERARVFGAILRLAREGSLRLPHQACFPLSDAKAALAVAASPSCRGKILLL